MLSVVDLHQFLLVKICFFLFLFFGLLVVYRKWKPSIFLLGFGAVNAAAYFFLTHGTHLMFWGLTADEITIAAMYQTFAHGHIVSDFAYANLPPFYPSLWFQAAAMLGRLFDWNGVQIAKAAAFITMALFPLFFYSVQQWYWRTSKDIPPVPSAFAALLASLLLFVIVDWDAIILKPYEMVSASLVILWTCFLVRDIHQNRINKRRRALYGITGGILFLMFYFWFFLAAIGVGLFHLFTKPSVKMYLHFVSIGMMVVILGAFYWFPLMQTYTNLGAENWQLGFFIKEWIATETFSLSFSIKSVLFTSGIASLIFLRHHIYMRTLLSLWVAGYVWQLMGIVTLLWFSSPLQESKGFFFWNRAILVLAVAYGVDQVYRWAKERYAIPVVQEKSLLLIGLIVLAPTILSGTFSDREEVQAVRERAKEFRLGVESVANYLKTEPDIHQRILLTSGIPELHALVPLNTFVYFNQHNSHPAAHFSERVAYVRELAIQTDPAVLARLSQETPFGPIDLFLFYKGVRDMYPVYVVLDDFPNGIREEEILIPRALFDTAYFDTVYENGQYILLKPVL